MKFLLFILAVFFITTLHAQEEDTTIYGYRDSGAALKVQMEPNFMGGGQMLEFYIKRDLIYPKDALKKHIEGTVLLDFVVEKTGWSDKIKIIEGVCPSIDLEAIRLIRKLNWIPAAQAGHDVRYRERRSIDFSLDSQ
jgi:protein TonB